MTLTPYLLEEANEVLDAVTDGNPSHIREELGDLLYVTIFALHAAESEGIGSVEAIVDATCDKLVRRHPHVFGDRPTDDPDAARLAWQQAKQAEGKTDQKSVLGSPPRAHPALLGAYRLQEKASAVGFDFPDVSGPMAKVHEECAELADVVGDPTRAREELGDLLFSVANVSRFLRIDPEAALRGANRRFFDRFHWMERRAAERGRPLDALSAADLDALWTESKHAFASGEPPIGEGST